MYNMIITSENKNTHYMLKKRKKMKKREGPAKANPNEFWAMSGSAINNNI